MQFQNNQTAIVLVEFQKQWTEKGLFNQLIKHQLDSTNVVRNTQHLVAKAREIGIPVIHAPLVVDPHNKNGWLAHLTFGQIAARSRECLILNANGIGGIERRQLQSTEGIG